MVASKRVNVGLPITGVIGGEATVVEMDVSVAAGTVLTVMRHLLGTSRAFAEIDLV